MRLVVSPVSLVPALALGLTLVGCDGCKGDPGPSAAERDKALASAIAAPKPSASGAPVDTIGHPANVIPGQGPKRVESTTPRMGLPLPILPGQGVGPIRFGATKQTIERLMGVPCDDATETSCRYVARAVDFKIEASGVTEIKVSRKGREAKKASDGSIIEYGFFNGTILPDLYFGMQPVAVQEHLGVPRKVEPVTPMGADGFAERHIYDGLTLEYDRWSNGKLVLGAAILTKSAAAAAATQKVLDDMAAKAAEQAKLAAKTRPNKVPR